MISQSLTTSYDSETHPKCNSSWSSLRKTSWKSNDMLRTVSTQSSIVATIIEHTPFHSTIVDVFYYMIHIYIYSYILYMIVF